MQAQIERFQTALKEREEKCQAEKDELRAEISQLHGEIEALQYDKSQLLKTERRGSDQSQNGNDTELPEHAVAILKLLADEEIRGERKADYTFVAAVSLDTDLHPSAVQHYLDELSEAGFAGTELDEYKGIIFWKISRAGRAYLVKRGLIGLFEPL